MWTKLTLVLKTIIFISIFCCSLESRHVANKLKHNVVTVKRIKIRERFKSAVNISGEAIGYQNATRPAAFLDRFNAERRTRCRRYAQLYYGQSQVNADFNQYSGYYVQPQYVPYSPPKCYAYCRDCPTSMCRRRCPMLQETSFPNRGTISGGLK